MNHDSSPPSRAQARDYAVLSATYLVGLGGLAWIAGRKGDDRLDQLDLAQLVLATFTVADAVAHEKIAHWIRAPFLEETAQHRPSEPRGHGLRYTVGELLSCSRCVGTWSALGLMGLRFASPRGGRAVITVFAAAAANDFAQAGFSWLTANTNRVEGTGST